MSVRVLLSGVCLGQPMSGVRRRAAELLPRAARRLAERGGGLSVLEGREPITFDLPPEVERLPSRVPAGPPIARALQEERALRRVLDEARAAGRAFDLVHTAHFPVPRRLPVPFTVTIHDLRSLTLAHTPFSRRLVARHVLGGAFRRAARTLVVSRTVEAEVRERFGVDTVTCVPNAADHLDVQPRRAAADSPLLAVGHVEPRKNLELLLEALAKDPGLPHLEIAGRERGQEGDRLRARSRALGIEERVRFLGPVDDAALVELYARTACVVFPSRCEGFGIPALEALRAGAPLVVSSAGALPEVAGPDVPTFAPDDAEACARAIRAALEVPASVLEARRARADAYDWETSARGLVEAWIDAARKPGSSAALPPSA